MKKPLNLGATGRFPEGKLNPDDEGELRCAIHIEADCVRLDFGKNVSWLSVTPTDARRLAALLIEKANTIENRSG